MSTVKADHINQFPESPENLLSRSNMLADFISSFNYRQIPEDTVTVVKHFIIDTIASAFAGSFEDSGRIQSRIINMMGGEPQAGVIGSSVKFPFPFAAQVNAKMSNAIDLDDTYMNVSHFAPQSFWGAFSAGEHIRENGRKLISSVLLGYEIGARICLSFTFWRVRRGTITTRGSRQAYAANPFSAMASTGHMLGLDKNQMRDAFGNCGHFAPSLTRSIMVVAPYDEMNKYCDAGWSTYSGVMAALFAQYGYRSTHYSLDGRDGYADIMGIDFPDNAKLTENLGEEFHIRDSAFKKFPVCKYAHTALDLCGRMLDKHSIAPEDIEKIDVYVRPSHAVGFSARELPEESNMPFTHNIPYNISQMIFGRKSNSEWYDRKYLKDPEIKSMMKRIFTHICGEALTTGIEDIRRYGFPREIPVQVEIKTDNGNYSERAARTKGDPWWDKTRFSENDLYEKLLTACERRLDKNSVDSLFEKLLKLEEIDDISELASYISSPG